MNCRQFEDSILSLVRENALEEQVRIQVLAHAEGCSRCSALLADQRALSGLLKLASADERQAPEHLEAALVSTYRVRQASAARDVVLLPAKRAWSSRYRAIAAMLLVALLGFAAMLMLRIRQPEQIPLSRSGSLQEPRTVEIATDFFALTSRAELEGTKHSSAQFFSHIEP